MLNISITEGALFYGSIRRRHRVVFTEALREETARLATRLHELTWQGITPAASYEKKCRKCSLLSWCMPRFVGRSKSAVRYLAVAIKQSVEDEV
jgi:CRISPR-associated exonuclease Cas4